MTEQEKIEIHKYLIQNNIIDELEKFVEARSIKKADLAKTLNVSRSFISQLYSGEKFFSLELLAKLQLFLNLKVSLELKPVKEFSEKRDAKHFSMTFNSHIMQYNVSHVLPDDSKEVMRQKSCHEYA